MAVPWKVFKVGDDDAAAGVGDGDVLLMTGGWMLRDDAGMEGAAETGGIEAEKTVCVDDGLLMVTVDDG